MIKHIISNQFDKFVDIELPGLIKKTNCESGQHVNIRELQNFLKSHERKQKFQNNLLAQFKILEEKGKIYDLRHTKKIREIANDFAKLFCILSIKERINTPLDETI